MAKRTAAKIPFDEFVGTTLASLLRALQTQRLPHGPIIIGIIYQPEELGRTTVAGIGRARSRSVASEA
jgi:hypothetical protein